MTKDDLRGGLDSLEHRLTGQMERLARRVVMWTSTNGPGRRQPAVCRWQIRLNAAR